MRSRIVLTAFIAVFLTACSKGTAPPAQQPVTAPPPAAVTAQEQPTVDSRPEIDRLNDQVFQLIKEQKWAEAIATANRALQVAPGSTAAWFNRGRAYLGAARASDAVHDLNEASRRTGGGNADVEYYRGQAMEAARQPFQAGVVYRMALARLPGDKEIAAALADLRQRESSLAPVALDADVDLDGKPDRITVDLLHVTVVSAAGTTLYDGDPFGPDINEPPYAGEPLLMESVPDGPPLIHLQAGGCPSYYNHAILWFDSSQKAVRQVKLDAACSLLNTDGKGSFRAAYRSGVHMVYKDWRWEAGAFVPQPSPSQELLTEQVVNASNLKSVVSEILSGKMTGADMLFAPPELYRTFLDTFGKAGWTAGEVIDQGADPVRLPMLEGGQVKAYLVFSVREHHVTSIEWVVK